MIAPVDTCRVCGNALQQPPRGRKKEYCSPACRQLEASILRTETLLTEVVPSLDAERRKALRSRLWNLANLANSKEIR